MMFNNEWDLSNTIDISNTNLAESILRLRKIDNLDNFLYPKLDYLYDPFLINEMDKAIKRIIFAVKNDELILIYGDYDTDGITATAIMYRFLKSIGANVKYYIPRREEGYGLSIEILENILTEDIGLMITVDCGITSVKELEFINDIGIDCIISDHHTPLDTIPDAYCIISPKLPDSNYPFSDLCGAGIAFKIIQALCISLDCGYEYARYIDLAALGTIADVVPLKNENRIIAKIGMDRIALTDNTGLKELLKQSYPYGIDKVNSSHLLFNIIPKINASGRMDTAEYAINLLISDDYQECKNLAEKLILFNEERKNRQKEITRSVIQRIQNDKDIINDLVFVLEDKNWDMGVLGIVASHIVEKYNRPCILLTTDGKYESIDEKENSNRVLKGSGRSVANFNLISAIDYTKELQITYGGHKIAAGNMIYDYNLAKFRYEINKYARDIGFKVSERKAISPDFKIDVNDVTVDNAQVLSCMEPHGSENESALFMIEDLEFDSYREIGKNKEHISISFNKNGKYINCISFNSSDYSRLLLTGSKYDIIFKLSYNTAKDSNSTSFQTRKYVNCEITDIKIKDIPQSIINDLIIYSKRDVIINRNDVVNVYKFIKNSEIPLKLQLHETTNIPQFIICLDILQELGIIKYNNINFKFIYINELNDKVKKDINESITYIKVNKEDNNGRL